MSHDPLPPLFDEEETIPALELPADEPAANAFERFAILLTRKRKLADELEQIDKDLTRLQPHLLHWFDENPNIPRLALEDKTGQWGYNLTIFTRRDLYARAKEEGPAGRQAVCDALRANRLGQFVFDSFNVNTLSAHVRALERNYAEELKRGEIPDTAALLPPDLAAVLDINPTLKVVGQRRSRSK
jgi:hypothetical protein